MSEESPKAKPPKSTRKWQKGTGENSNRNTGTGPRGAKESIGGFRTTKPTRTTTNTGFAKAEPKDKKTGGKVRTKEIIGSARSKKGGGSARPTTSPTRPRQDEVGTNKKPKGGKKSTVEQTMEKICTELQHVDKECAKHLYYDWRLKFLEKRDLEKQYKKVAKAYKKAEGKEVPGESGWLAWFSSHELAKEVYLLFEQFVIDQYGGENILFHHAFNELKRTKADPKLFMEKFFEMFERFIDERNSNNKREKETVNFDNKTPLYELYDQLK